MVLIFLKDGVLVTRHSYGVLYTGTAIIHSKIFLCNLRSICSGDQEAVCTNVNRYDIKMVHSGALNDPQKASCSENGKTACS